MTSAGKHATSATCSKGGNKCEKFRLAPRPPQSRKHCFLATQTGKHLLKKRNVSEKSQKHFLFLASKKCLRNKCFLSAQTGKHLGKQQCFRNNVSSFAGALRPRNDSGRINWCQARKRFNQCQAQGKIQPVPSAGKDSTSAQREKRFKQCQTREKIQPVPSAGKISTSAKHKKKDSISLNPVIVILVFFPAPIS